jgi:hypothetical protein
MSESRQQQRGRGGAGAATTTTTLAAVPEEAVSSGGGGSGGAGGGRDWGAGRELGRGGALAPAGSTSRQRQEHALVAGAERASVFEDKPWAAPSVQALSRRRGPEQGARPLEVEGMLGCVISAVGTDRDHEVASATLRARGGPHQGGGPSYQRTAVFGAVYEHRDCFGKPKYIGETDNAPEVRYQQDINKHQAVKNLVTQQQGRSEVVWSGRSGTMAAADMQSITESIVGRRAAELQAEKLGGPKPYSSHGY